MQRETKSGDATPEEAIRSFFTAIADADPEAACSLLVAPEKMREYCRIQSNLSTSFRSLAEAGEAAFGEEGRVFRAGIPAHGAMQRLAEVEAVVDGDTAVWPSNPRAPMKLQRINGGWRLDLYSSFQKPQQLKMTNLIFERIANYVGEVAQGIRAGDHQSVAAVQAELRRQRQLMEEQLVPKLREASK
ncbi:MAG: hypothetical protein KDA42_11685 [Planctomycetales bacterium]|nr:hypothetical protein [Planctomycetales bacterium]